MVLLEDHSHVGHAMQAPLTSVNQLARRFNVPLIKTHVGLNFASEIAAKLAKWEWAAPNATSASQTSGKILTTHGTLALDWSPFWTFNSNRASFRTPTFCLLYCHLKQHKLRFTHTQCRPEDMFGQSVCRQCCHQSYCNRGTAPGTTPAWFNPTAKYQSRVDWAADRA